MACGGAWLPRLPLLGGLPPPLVGRRFVGFPSPSLCPLLPRLCLCLVQMLLKAAVGALQARRYITLILL